MRKLIALALFWASASLLAASPAAAQPTITPSAGTTVNFNIGLPVSFNVVASTPVGTITSVTTTPLPPGATFSLLTVVGGTTTYQFQWTPSLGQGSAFVTFQANASGGQTASVTVNLVQQIAEIIYVSGIVRDFPKTHVDFNSPNGDTVPFALVDSDLGPDGKPVFIGSGATTVDNGTTFNQWWNTTAGVNQQQVFSATLSNSFQPDTRVFQYSSTAFYPIDGQLLGNDAPPHNNFFTYELHTYLEYHQGVSLTFRSSDDLWVFIDGHLAVNMGGVHGVQISTLNMDTLGLVDGTAHRADIFFAHRGVHPPQLQLQLTKAEIVICSGSTGPQVALPFSAASTTTLGPASIVSGKLKLEGPAASAPDASAGWLQTKYPLGLGFALEFDLKITGAGEGAAVVFARNKNGLGGAGSNLGYAPIDHSLAVEFDNHQDTPNFDPTNSHIAAHSNFAALNSAQEVGPPPIGSQLGISVFDPVLPLTFANGSPNHIRVEYLPAPRIADGKPEYGWLRVFMNQNIVPTMEAQIDGVKLRADLLQGELGYIGFTASNGVTSTGTPILEDVEISNVQLRSAIPSAIESAVSVPPTGITLGGVGHMTLQTRDACGYAYPLGGNAARWTVDMTDGPAPLLATIADQSNGNYLVSYTPSTYGHWFAEVRFDGELAKPVGLNPYDIVVAAPDTDGDGVTDPNDNCVAIANADQLNTDGDLQGNACDADDDNDGHPDNLDAFPLSAAEWQDTDGDGIGNNTDLDDDGDGQLDVDEVACLSNPLLASSLSADFDGDHSPDCVDADDDNDGTPDTLDALPFNPLETVDTDHDGIGNNADPDDDNDGVLDAADAFPLDNAESVDTDHDGIGNNADPDDDNDGVLDAADAFPLDNTESVDTDHDGIGNNADPDDDNDGVLDAADAFPLDIAESVDTDHDGIGNNADPDDDNDGVLDADDAFPLDKTESVDTNGDHVGNNADLDDDGDGVLDANDAFPLNATESVDTDHDGIGNNANPDDDNDGVLDAADAFPLDIAESVDTDGNHIGNNADPDDDNDGVLDAADAFPLDKNESVDTDGDRIGNNADPDDDNDGVLDAADAFPLDHTESVDTDHDGVGNNADPDDDNDGVLDANDAFPLDGTESVDTDGDHVGNNADLDDDGDGVLDANDAFPLNAAESVDSDGDGIGDNADPDDDNDGVPDAADQCPLVAGTGADGCAPTGVVTLAGPQAPFSPGATYNGKQAVPLKWQYASGGVVVSSASAAPIVRFYGTVACGATGGGASVPATAAGNSGLQYDATSKTWQFNWKPNLPNGGYYFTITNQQTGVTSAPFAVCLGK